MTTLMIGARVLVTAPVFSLLQFLVGLGSPKAVF